MKFIVIPGIENAHETNYDHQGRKRERNYR